MIFLQGKKIKKKQQNNTINLIANLSIYLKKYFFLITYKPAKWLINNIVPQKMTLTDAISVILKQCIIKIQSKNPLQKFN